ncbi:hypothetical protein DSO57_1012588 [Entomophthora muscae]|uniref:Uncharacterized protein n=1 Tax=Entomophthora muscae TaxID=34485 RepID=A0ACC2UQR8_9FUNG|nr:hypothetical protein DSO57_1012588 [Entomophthora muscae]
MSIRPGEQILVSKSYLPADFFNQATKGLLTPSQFREKIEKQSAPKPTKEKEAEVKATLKRPVQDSAVAHKHAARKTRSSKKLPLTDGSSDDDGSMYKSE